MTITERHALLDLIDMLFRRRVRIVLIAVLTVAAALAYNALHGATYTATARVLVTPAMADLPLSRLESGATLVLPDHGQTARNQAELLADPGLVAKLLPIQPDQTQPGLVDRLAGQAFAGWRKLAEKLGLLAPATPAEAFAARLSRALTIRAVGDTDVVKLDLTWDDRIGAAATLNAVVAGYRHAIAAAAEAREETHRADTHLADTQAELTALDRTIDAARAAAAASLPGQDKSGIQAALDTTRTGADAMRLERELARRKLAAAEQAYRSGGWVDAADGQATGTAKLAQNFAKLLKQRQDLLATAAADSPEIHAVDVQISQVREQNYRGVRRLYAAQISALDDRIAAADATIATGLATLRGLDTHLAEAAVMAQARDAKARQLANDKRLAEAAHDRIDAAWQEVGGTRALSEAIPPIAPDFPAPPLLLRLAMLGGLAAGLGSAVLAERGRATIDRPIDIARRLNIEVLARLDDVKIARLR